MKSKRSLKTLLWSLGFAACLAAGCLLTWRYSEIREAARESRSECRFAQIRLMLLMYHDEHGAFPPTKFHAKAGAPPQSWRVLLVPYSDTFYKERYLKYDFLQRWDSEQNARTLGSMPQFDYYSMFGDESGITNYLAIGEGDEWPSKYPLKSLVVTKGTDRFIIVELPDSKINWMEPTY